MNHSHLLGVSQNGQGWRGAWLARDRGSSSFFPRAGVQPSPSTGHPRKGNPDEQRPSSHEGFIWESAWTTGNDPLRRHRCRPHPLCVSLSHFLPPSLPSSFSASPLFSCPSPSVRSVSSSFPVHLISVFLSFPILLILPSQFSSSVFMCVLYFLLFLSRFVLCACYLSLGQGHLCGKPAHSRRSQAVLSTLPLPTSGSSLLPHRLPSGFWGILSSSWEDGL